MANNTGTLVTPTNTPATVATLPAHMAPNANWQLLAKGPATKAYVPGPRTVAYVALAALTPNGATMATVQAAVQAQATTQGLRGAHPAYALLAWLARVHGYTFTCTGGMVTYTVQLAVQAPATAPTTVQPAKPAKPGK